MPANEARRTALQLSRAGAFGAPLFSDVGITLVRLRKERPGTRGFLLCPQPAIWRFLRPNLDIVSQTEILLRTSCPWLQAPAGPGADTMSRGVGTSAVIMSANSLHDTAACGHVLDPASAASHAGGLGGAMWLCLWSGQTTCCVCGLCNNCT